MLLGGLLGANAVVWLPNPVITEETVADNGVSTTSKLNVSKWTLPASELSKPTITTKRNITICKASASRIPNRAFTSCAAAARQPK